MSKMAMSPSRARVIPVIDFANRVSELMISHFVEVLEDASNLPIEFLEIT